MSPRPVLGGAAPVAPDAPAPHATLQGEAPFFILPPKDRPFTTPNLYRRLQPDDPHG
jgi:hypothetical protein